MNHVAHVTLSARVRRRRPRGPRAATPAWRATAAKEQKVKAMMTYFLPRRLPIG